MSDSTDKNPAKYDWFASQKRKMRPYGEAESNYSTPRERGSDRNYRMDSPRFGCWKISVEAWRNARRGIKKLARRKAKEEIKRELAE